MVAAIKIKLIDLLEILSDRQPSVFRVPLGNE